MQDLETTQKDTTNIISRPLFTISVSKIIKLCAAIIMYQ